MGFLGDLIAGLSTHILGGWTSNTCGEKEVLIL